MSGQNGTNGPTRGNSLVQMETRNSTYQPLSGGETGRNKHLPSYRAMGCFLGIFLVLALAAVAVMTILYLNERSENRGASITRLSSQCPCGNLDAPAAQTAKPDKIRGVNIGGFLVLEPNVSPSLFYQFLGDSEPAVDMRNFCLKLGPEEGNRQLRNFWKEWVTREDIEFLASTGINTLRVPIGYWMLQKEPDEPYAGCTDGSLNELLRLIGLAKDNGLDVVLDLHAAKNSQNGFDNSGWTRDTVFDKSFPGTYERVLNPQWILNQTVVDETVDQLVLAARCFTCEPNVVGMSVLNEPFFLPVLALAAFYTDAYKQIKKVAPHWKIQASDNFLTDDQSWAGFWTDDEFFSDGAIDTHIYHIFEPGLLESSFEFHLNFACQHGEDIKARELTGASLIVGEWSLATDDCAMWLLGLNQISQYNELNTPANCSMTKCPGSEGHPSPRPGLDGPDGEGNCPVDAKMDDGYLQSFGMRQLNSFNQASGGWFYWNFKSELEERWSWIQSVKNGWLPSDISNIDEEEDVLRACDVTATEPPPTQPPIDEEGIPPQNEDVL